ncbi:carboxypeptidase-like regulatory domain-containing protein [Salinimicrobium sp. CAU 1759]
MKRIFLGRIFLLFLLLQCPIIRAQSITGTVIDEFSGQPLPGVLVKISGAAIERYTDENGVFDLSEELPEGENTLTLSKNAFFDKHFPVKISSEVIDLGIITLKPDLPEMQQQMTVISLEENELDEEDGSSANISGLLQASRDVFLNAAAYDFSPTFFRPRGYDSEYSKVLINGVEMNKFFTGRPLWSNWGGLNDVQRNQEFTYGTLPSESSFGGPAGTTNIVMRASQYPNGGKFSYATANRSYSGRAMASYHSGLLPSGWAYSLSMSKRFGSEGYVEGTSYDATSFFTSVEKKIDDSHSLNFTVVYTPVSVGKSSPVSEEVAALKGQKYNSYWGWDKGEIRNSRIREVQEPILMLNHTWSLNNDLKINSNVAYQFGKVSNSRIDYGGSRLYSSAGSEEILIGGGSNPDPSYYQNLPSYHLRNTYAPDYRAAFLAEQDFRKNGQLKWEDLYRANQTSMTAGGNAIYALYEDRNDDRQISGSSNFRYQWNTLVVLSGGVAYRQLQSENFASVLDLFGAVNFLDVVPFSSGFEAQNDLQNPNQMVSKNDKFKYNYILDANTGSGFLQAEFNFKRMEYYVAAQGSGTSFQRTGIFQNGNFPENSLGESRVLNFGNYGAKSGLTYKMSGRHYFSANLAHFTKPPGLRNSFSNVRQNNDAVLGLNNEKIFTADAGYNIRTPFLTGRLTGFYGEFRDITEVSFFYADGITGSAREVSNAFVQEILTGIGKRHMGIEFGFEVPLNNTLKLRSAGSFGKYIFHKDPEVYLTSDDFPEARQMGRSSLKNYHIPGGPQQALQAGFEYRDPAYWWISASANFFSKAFVDVAPLARTRNFYTDVDGFPIVGYHEKVASQLLKQEEFQGYMLVNMVGGKSWRLKNRFVGIFGSLNNILDTVYKTGGYEQSRNVNYSLLKADMEREQPLFGSKYWFGTGTTYYAHVYYRF